MATLSSTRTSLDTGPTNQRATTSTAIQSETLGPQTTEILPSTDSLQRTLNPTGATTSKPNRKQLWRYRKHIEQISNQPQPANKSTVVVLEPAQLTTEEQSILAKGLSFVPTKSCSSTQINQDFDNFQEQLINRATPFAYDLPRHPLIPNNEHSSSSISEQSLAPIQQYINNCKASFQQSNRQTSRRNNLSNRERQVLNSLKKRQDIIIKKADKGDTIVVEAIHNYTKDGLTHLSNNKFYHRLAEDFNPEINQSINKFLNNAHRRGLIDNNTFDYLSPPTNYRTPLIYFLKKLHKQPISVRPIVSHVNSPTCNISSFIDILLKPIVKEIPHILSNSTQLVKDLLTVNISNHTTLVSLDVTSLYPNIPITESIDIILKFIEDHNNPTHPPICIIKSLLSFVLKYNCFNFGDLFFLQVHGIAMGTKLAPNYANLFMADFENKFVFNYPIQPTYYRRYIDDIFFIWEYSTTELQQFIDHLNSRHPTIKFTQTISDKQITYLDLDIYINETRLHTKTHFKTTNTFSYLHGQSNHPPSTFKGVYKGENIRILRNTSDQDTYNNTCKFINNQFNNRKYPKYITNSPIIPFNDRDLYLNFSRSKTSHPLTFVTTFDPSISISEHLEEDWPRLTSNDDLKQIFRQPPTVSYKHSPNLSQILVRAKLDNNINTDLPIQSNPSLIHHTFPAKNIKCRNPQCGTCPQLTEHSHYSSYQTKQYYSINNIYSCDTTHAIYLLECTICHKQYVGETHNTIRNRMKHHRNMANTALNRPIYAHLKLHNQNFSIFSITIIDTIKDLTNRKSTEQQYIKLLKTKLPFGLNVITSTK